MKSFWPQLSLFSVFLLFVSCSIPDNTGERIESFSQLTEFFGDTPAAALSRTDFDRFSAERMAGGVGPHTPNRDLACMRAALTHAAGKEARDNVCRRVDGSRRPESFDIAEWLEIARLAQDGDVAETQG